MKKPIVRILALLLLLATLPLAGCANTFFEEEEFMIHFFDEKLPDGSIKIRVQYSDEDIPPYEFIVPQGVSGEDGKDGKDGLGIKDILVEPDKDNRKTLLRITYTDEEKEQTVLELPDGVSVVGMEQGTEELTGKKYIKFRYSDDSYSEEVFLPDGVVGNGIEAFEHVLNPDNSISVTVRFTDGTTKLLNIPAGTPGLPGVGVVQMVAGENPDTDEYTVKVTYSDGKEETLFFKRPADPNKWHLTREEPSNMIGKNGDFCFDTEHKVIYAKEDGTWYDIYSFTMEDTQYRITFDLNDDPDDDAKFPASARPYYTVMRGAYFSADGNGDIPIPERPGYTFRGWYTKKTVTPETMSPFTDLTAVFSDLTLYAYWEKNN